MWVLKFLVGKDELGLLKPIKCLTDSSLKLYSETFTSFLALTTYSDNKNVLFFRVNCVS